jgi:cytochrome c biogenesis protein CcmG, thiol:disulfide interchange protein DsbE
MGTSSQFVGQTISHYRIADSESATAMCRVHHSIFVRRIAVFPLLMLILNGCYSGTRPPHVGKVAPDFSVQDSDHKVSLSDFHGKIVVLNFWATFCPPCVDEMPSLVQMDQRLKDKGIAVLGISIDVDADAYHRFLKDYKVGFVTVRDPDQKSATLYGTHGWPETYIIDRNGIVRRKFIGPVDWSQPEIVEFLTKL